MKALWNSTKAARATGRVHKMSTATMDALRQRKEALRRTVRANLSKLSAEEIEQQSQSIVRQVRNLPEYQHAKAISVFLSMPGKEVSTREIVLDAIQQGKAVYVPYIYAVGEGKGKQKVMDMLRLRDQIDFDSLVPDGWGIPSLDADSVHQRANALGGNGLLQDNEPSTNSSPDLDLIFMPAVAFDQSRNRLGHGKGFYDRYLEKYHKATARKERDMPRLVGLALQQQLLSQGEDVPTDEQDWVVDTIVTP